MKEINPDHEFNITFRESDRVFLQMMLRFKSNDIAKEIDKAKSEDDEYTAKYLADFERILENLLDQIDIQVQQAEMEEDE